MRKIFCTCLMLLVYLCVLAQEPKDSAGLKLEIASDWYAKGVDMYAVNYDSAYNCMSQAYVIFKEVGFSKYEAMSLHAMADCLARTDKLDQSLDLYNITDSVAADYGNAKLLLEVLNDKQKLLLTMGKMQERKAVMGRIMELKYEGNNVIDEVNFYRLKGDIARKNGDYQLAEQMFQNGLDKVHLLPDEVKPNLTSLLWQYMEDLHFEKRDYLRALKFRKNMLGLRRQRVNIDNLETSAPSEIFRLTSDYLRISYYYSCLNDEPMTMLYMDSASLCIGNNTKLWMSVYGLQIISLKNLHKYDKALELTCKMDSMISYEYGVHSKNRYDGLMQKGSLLYLLSKHQESAETYAECEQLARLVYGEGSEEHVQAMRGLVNSLAFAGQVEEGAAKYVELEKMLSRIIKEMMGSMSQSERETYWNKVAKIMQQMTSYGLKGNVQSKDFVEAGCNALIFSKSLLLESEVSLQDLVNQRGTKEDKECMERIKQTKNSIEKLSSDYDCYADTIAQMKQQVLQDDWLLCARFPEYAEYTKFLDISIDSIRNAMPANSVLIDYADIKTKTNYYHAAYVTCKKDNSTHMQLVFDWQSVDSLLDGASIDALYETYLNAEARQLIWDSLSQYVDEGCTIYYVPSGMMHRISLESLIAPDGKLLSEHYHFVRLLSAREILRQHDRMLKPKRAVLYGGLQYDMSPASMLAESKKYESSHSIAETRGEMRGDSTFKPLPATKEEIDQIAAILNRRNIKVTPYFGEEGCEESFMSLSGQAPHVLHVATHGFYYTPEKASNVSFLKGYNTAMMMSGLVMSGANAARQGRRLDHGVCDGLLRAGDIAKMNLKGTNLVVLSACQTGLGQVTSEGVFGLQRAFKLAGVETIIMTLWSVDDKATKEFMVKFYDRLAANKWNKRQAFNDARDYMRSKYPTLPYYWAGFVMVD